MSMSTVTSPRCHRTLRGVGGYSVLEVAIVLPVVFLLTMTLVQWAIVWHARSVAEAAAQEGLRTTQGYQSTAEAGRADTLTYLNAVAGKSLPHPQITVTRDATSATVTVDATVASVIPFGHFHIRETATGPVETYTAATP